MRVPSNRFILAAAPVAGIAWSVWKVASGHPWDHAAARFVVAAGVTLLAWALGRELDPDRPWTAGVAAVLGAAVLGAGIPSLWVAGAVMITARVASRSTGMAPADIDLAVLVGAAAGAGATDTGLWAGVMLGAALVADRWLPGPSHRFTLHAGVAAVGAAVATAAVWGNLVPQPGLPHGPEWVVAPVAVAGILILVRPAAVRSVGDLGGVTLLPVRVRAGRVAAAAAAVLGFSWAGGPGLTASSAVWVALAAGALPGPATVEPRRG